MKIKFAKSAAVLVLVGALSAAPALASDAGWYMGAGVGVNWTNDTVHDLTTGDHDTNFEAGWAGFLKGGYDWGSWRAELEYAHRNNDANYFGPSGSIARANGSVNSDALMLNAYYDFAATGKVTPYIGAGLGAVRVEANDVRRSVNNTAVLSGDDTVVGAQLMAGAAYALTPNVDATLEYKFLIAQEPDFNYATGCSYPSACSNVGTASDGYRNHTIAAGLRWRLN